MMRAIHAGDPTQEWGRWYEWRGEMFRTAIVSCPECGRLASLAGHEIMASGRVFPAVRCPQHGCPWEEAIKLEGWPAADSASGAA